MKTYIVIGGSGGIGSELSRKLVSRGERVIAAARNEERLRALSSEIGVVAKSVEATDFESVDSLIQSTVAEFGELAGVVNCVGSITLKPAHLTSSAEFQESLAKNLTSAFATVRSATKAMLNTGGSVVLVSTAAARIGIANHEAIAAAKGGVLSLTMSAAATYAPKNIRINCVAPGLTETPLSERITKVEASRKVSLAMHALGRLGQPSDVASMIEFLLRPENSWITGQCFGVDGGLGTLR
jgi:NAD(P)-dependent dehydrogenase (short-subunit alcohol dehydrogenase family)